MSKTLIKLQHEYDSLLPNEKNKERLKGTKSKFLPVFKSRGFKWQASKKHGGKITYKMTGGQVVDAGYD